MPSPQKSAVSEKVSASELHSQHKNQVTKCQRQNQPNRLPRKLSFDGHKRWALTPCAHCRDYTSTPCVLTCYGKVAHHREVKLVGDVGVRESVGVISETQELLFQNTLLPAATGPLDTVIRLDQDAVDRGVLVTVSCELCAGQPLGGCIDAGHEQQERYTENLPRKHTRRASRPPATTPKGPNAAGTEGRKEGGGDSVANGSVGFGTSIAGTSGVDAPRGTIRSITLDGARYAVPTFIYPIALGFKLILSWAKGRFLIDGGPCASGKAVLGSEPKGVTYDLLVRKMAMRDELWWNKTATVHPLIAAYAVRIWLPQKSPSAHDDKPLRISLRGNDDPSATLLTTRRQLRAIYEARDQLLHDVASRPSSAYQCRPCRLDGGETNSTPQAENGTAVSTPIRACSRSGDDTSPCSSSCTPRPSVGGTPHSCGGTPSSASTSDSDSSAAPGQHSATEGDVSGGTAVNESGNGGIVVSVNGSSKGTGVVQGLDVVENGTEKATKVAKATTTISPGKRKRSRTATNTTATNQDSNGHVDGGSGECVTRRCQSIRDDGPGSRDGDRNNTPQKDNPTSDGRSSTATVLHEATENGGNGPDSGGRTSKIRRRSIASNGTAVTMTFQTVTPKGQPGNEQAVLITGGHISNGGSPRNDGGGPRNMCSASGGHGVDGVGQKPLASCGASLRTGGDVPNGKQSADCDVVESDVPEGCCAVVETGKKRQKRTLTGDTTSRVGDCEKGKHSKGSSSTSDKVDAERNQGRTREKNGSFGETIPVASPTEAKGSSEKPKNCGGGSGVKAVDSTVPSSAVALPAEERDEPEQANDNSSSDEAKRAKLSGTVKSVEGVDGEVKEARRSNNVDDGLEHVRRIEEARFVECQRREMNEEKRRCREELAALEAQLEAVKEGMRQHLQGIIERHKRERFAFRASVFRNVDDRRENQEEATAQSPGPCS